MEIFLSFFSLPSSLSKVDFILGLSLYFFPFFISAFLTPFLLSVSLENSGISTQTP